jgi:hypothetical protein
MVRLPRLLLAVAALDSAAMGLWANAFPEQLFGLLQIKSPADGFLWPVLGLLYLVNALCLAGAAMWPVEYGSLTLVPWVGRLLSCGMWLWLLGSRHINPAHEPLWWLLAHDAFWLVLLTGVLVAHFGSRRR